MSPVGVPPVVAAMTSATKDGFVPATAGRTNVAAKAVHMISR